MRWEDIKTIKNKIKNIIGNNKEDTEEACRYIQYLYRELSKLNNKKGVVVKHKHYQISLVFDFKKEKIYIIKNGFKKMLNVKKVYRDILLIKRSNSSHIDLFM